MGEHGLFLRQGTIVDATLIHVADVTQVDKLLHGTESVVSADEEDRTTDDAVRPVKLVNGSSAFADRHRKSASVIWR